MVPAAAVVGYQIRGYAVVYDRHFLYDLHSMGSMPRSNQLTSAYITGGFWRNAIPHPHLTIYLDAPAEVLFAARAKRRWKNWSAAVRLSFN